MERRAGRNTWDQSFKLFFFSLVGDAAATWTAQFYTSTRHVSRRLSGLRERAVSGSH
jgi:hypothetical protein